MGCSVNFAELALCFRYPADAASAWVLASDVALKLVDGLLLVGDDPLHQITDGENPHYLVVFQDREVAHPLVGHDGHALVDRVPGGHVEHRTTHDLGHPRL